MESNDFSSAIVKRYGVEIASDFARLHRDISDYRTRDLFARLLGYLHATFRHGGMRYKWQRELLRSFAKTSAQRGRLGYSLTHVEDAFPVFKRWIAAGVGSFKFSFERVGRSNRAKIEPGWGDAGPADAGEIFARLAGAIRRTVQLAGRCHCDLRFIRKFSEISRLPYPAVAGVWQRITSIEGVRGRWRGMGNGRKFVAHAIPAPKISTGPDAAANFSVSPPPTCRVFSPPTEGRDSKQRAALRPGLDPESALASLASNRVEGNTARGVAPPGPHSDVSASANSHRPGFSKGWDVQTNGALTSGKGPTACPQNSHPFPDGRASQICERWVSLRKLRGLARWLAFGPLKNLHREFPRVVFRPAHAQNFAFEAVQLGYTAAAVVRAWRAGVTRSHEDALDRDRLPGGGYASQREPSAAKVYAMGALTAEDARSWRDRWAEFFAAAPRCRNRKENSDTSAAVDVAKGGGGAACSSAVSDVRGRDSVEAASHSGSGAGGLADHSPLASEVPRSRRAVSGATRSTEAPRFTAAEAAEKLRELRAKIGKRPRVEVAEGEGISGPALTAPQLAEFLRGKGMTLATFNGLPWPWKKKLWEEARKIYG